MREKVLHCLRWDHHHHAGTTRDGKMGLGGETSRTVPRYRLACGYRSARSEGVHAVSMLDTLLDVPSPPRSSRPWGPRRGAMARRGHGRGGGGGAAEEGAPYRRSVRRRHDVKPRRRQTRWRVPPHRANGRRGSWRAVYAAPARRAGHAAPGRWAHSAVWRDGRLALHGRRVTQRGRTGRGTALNAARRRRLRALLHAKHAEVIKLSAPRLTGDRLQVGGRALE